jgi:hypothetical protein
MLHFFRILMLGLLIIGSGRSVNAQPTAIDFSAGEVVQRYVDALPQGDAVTLKSLLSGRLLKSSERQLDDPGYSAFLVKHYSGTSLEVTDYHTLQPDTVAVNVAVKRSGLAACLIQYTVRWERRPGDSAYGLYIVDETRQ